jgi:L-lactate dehydrogenase complex protein LldF
MKANADLPFASTLCGSCSNVCPVKIDIHNQLYKWRQVLVKEGHVDKTKAMVLKATATTLASPRLYNWGGKLIRFVLKRFPGLLRGKVNVWYKQREMPSPPPQSFQEWYKANRKNG